MQQESTMQKTSRMTNSQPVPGCWMELENRHAARALQEVEERKKAGFAVTPEWLDALERKHIALALQEIAAHVHS
ncbi:MAG TPA: hypothetical protein VKR06_46675 [Ktedonosporobacter sp.]|nr:hypothetical protein [Ktedonosporobacter sp.]